MDLGTGDHSFLLERSKPMDPWSFGCDSRGTFPSFSLWDIGSLVSCKFSSKMLIQNYIWII